MIGAKVDREKGRGDRWLLLGMIGSPLLTLGLFLFYCFIPKIGLVGYWEMYFEKPFFWASPVICALCGLPFLLVLLNRVEKKKTRMIFIFLYIFLGLNVFYMAFTFSKVLLSFH